MRYCFFYYGKKTALIGVLSLSLGVVSSCKSTRTESLEQGIDGENALSSIYAKGTLNLNEELIPGDEEKRFDKYAEVFRAIHEKQQMINERNVSGDVGPGFHFRGMHAKGQGCLKGNFVVTTSDKRFKFGLFKELGKFPVVARFSNGSGEVKSDSDRDLRGLAVKISIGDMPQVAGHVQEGVHDLLMTNAPVHHARDIDELMEFIEADSAGGLKKAKFQLTHLRLVKTLLSQTQHEVKSLLNESYWSRSPYRLGPNQAIKYFVSPCESISVSEKSQADESKRLQADLDEQLQKGRDICFSFFVQPQVDPKREPIEIYNKEWTSPTYEVAKLVFPSQMPDRSPECENLVFNPWNAHADQKPLGNFNRARKYIYSAAEKFRSESPRKK